MKRTFFAAALVASMHAFAQETPVSLGASNCAEKAAKTVSYNNPEKVRISEPSGGAVEIINYHNQKVPARLFTLSANGQRIVCLTSEDGRRILQMN